MTVGTLLRRVSSRELTEWLAYDTLVARQRGTPPALSRPPQPDDEVQAALERAFPVTEP